MKRDISCLMEEWKNETNNLGSYEFDWKCTCPVKGKCGNVSYHSTMFFSYGMAIARRINRNRVLLIDPILSPSVTTTRHINEMKSICESNLTIILGADLTFQTNTISSHQRTTKDYIIAKMKQIENKYKRARGERVKQECEAEMKSLYKTLRFYWEQDEISLATFSPLENEEFAPLAKAIEEWEKDCN